MVGQQIKYYCPYNHSLSLKATYGHFATSHSHINCYIDMTTLKTRQTEAMAAAKSIARDYVTTTIVDTIVCMDGCDIIGAFLAEELSNAGIMSMNSHQSIYVITPEFQSSGQLLLRDNIKPMVDKKHILLLLASATTGKTIDKSLECITYYGGIVSGISAIFSAVDTVQGYPIHTIFHVSDIDNYHTYSHSQCPHCQKKEPLQAIVNSYGYSKL